MKENIENVDMYEQTTEDSRAYAIYVARNRAIPDFIDGLKPINRKILWCAAHEFRNKGFVKTATMDGSVAMNYSPHGTDPVRLAIRNMINNFSTKYPTMQGSGFWGTKVDPYPAADRYNYCKISNFATDVFIQDIYDDKRSTDWQDNYTNTLKEPVYLPAKIPTLLVLGQIGIAVGIKVSIPTHNLGDVIDTTIKLMHNPNADFCLIPDECMPCELIDTDWKKINETGSGNYISQGIIDIGEYNGHVALFIRSLPDYVYFDTIEETIKSLKKSGKMPYIVDMQSKSGVNKKNPNEYIFEEVIVLAKGSTRATAEFVKEFLYANTQIRVTRQVKLIVTKDNNLAIMNYRQYLLEFIKFRRGSIFRRLNARLQTLRTLMHESQLYIDLLTSGHINEVINMIRKNKSSDREEIVEFLVKKLRKTPVQARFLSKISLSQLSKGYLEECQKRMKKYSDEAKWITNTLLDPKKIDKIIIDEMLEIKNKYNSPKLCRIISKSEALGIAPGTFKLIFTKKNFIKKLAENEELPPAKYRDIKFHIIADNTEDLIVFSSLGKAFRLPVSKIPLSDKTSDGIDIRILNKHATSNICCAARESVLKSLASGSRKNFIFIVTKSGYIKKIDIDDVLSAPPSGIIYSKLEEGDYIQTLLFGPDKMDILVYSENKVLRISSKEIPYLRRSTKGNRVSTASTKIDGMNFLLPKATDLVVVTESGRVNRIPINVIEKSHRGRAPKKVIALGKTDKIRNIWPTIPEAKILVAEGRKSKEFPVKDIPIGSSIGSGIKLFSEANKVVLTF